MRLKRFWIIKEKRMIYNFRLVYTQSKDGIKLDVYDYAKGKWYQKKDIIEMDSIGLEDQRYNGEEVFEKDIILMSEEAKIEPNKKFVIRDYFGIPYGYLVTDSLPKLFDMRNLAVNVHRLCEDYLGNYNPKDGIAGRTIGNIFENLELIQEESDEPKV